MDLIKKLLEPNVEERWTAQQAVRHDWFLSRSRATPLSQGAVETYREAADYARATLRGLRRWRQHPFLRPSVCEWSSELWHINIVYYSIRYCYV